MVVPVGVHRMPQRRAAAASLSVSQSVSDVRCMPQQGAGSFSHLVSQ